MFKFEKKYTKCSPFTLFRSFFYVGLFTVGGGPAMLPIIEAEFVVKWKVITKEDMIDIFALAQSVPGIIAVNTALLTGFRLFGIFGGLMASLGVILPSFIIILIIAKLFDKIQSFSYVSNAFLGVRGAVTALIFMSAYNMAKSALKGRLTYVIFTVSLVMVLFFKVNVLFIILLSAIVGIIAYAFKKNKEN